MTAQYFVGLDIAADTFTAAIGTAPWHLLVHAVEFANSGDGFVDFQAWLRQQHVTPANATLCMEATGVYGETLAHLSCAAGYRLAIEPPLKVKRAFAPHGPKTDAVDSEQIAEYACRYLDELRFWQPPATVLEQVQVLLTTREQLTTQRTAHHNSLQMVRRKAVATPLAEQIHRDVLAQLKAHIQHIDRELRQLMEQHSTYRDYLTLLLTVPGVGLLLATRLIVLTQTHPELLNPKKLTAHLGICPFDYRSGKSVHKPTQSRHFGPPALRKLLYLASLSLRQHNAHFRAYFLRKVAEGKSKELVLNNIANKLIKIICAVLRTGTPFIPTYRSVKPSLLQSRGEPDLTKS